MLCDRWAERSAGIRNRCPLLAILFALASLLVPGIASASTTVGAETRVGASDLAEQVHVGVERSASLELPPGCGRASDDLASDSLLVPRGAAGAESALLAERFRASLSAQELATASRVGSGLKADSLHRAGSFVVDDVAQSGRVFALRGGDGVQRTLTQVEGTVNGQRGVFEWIVDPAGSVTHQRFIPDGRITGSPNQVP